MISFEPGRHLYWWDDKHIIPSVTGILGDNGHVSQFCKSDKHASRGTDIHRMVQIDCMHSSQVTSDMSVDLEELTILYEQEWIQWNNFKAETECCVIESEFLVYGFLDGNATGIPDWAGTGDLYVHFGKTDQLAYVDMKTGSSAPPYTNLQLCGYSIAHNPLCYDRTQRYSLRLDGKRKYKLKEYTDQSDYDRWIEEVKRWRRNQQLSNQ